LTDVDKGDSSEFLITTLGVAAISLIVFIVILSVLALTVAGRKEAKK